MRIGLVGFGYWGKIVWNNLNDMDYEVTICDPFLDFGIKDYRDLDVDCVFVLTPVDSHYEVCSHFLNKGVHVFCEKPRLQLLIKLFVCIEKPSKIMCVYLWIGFLLLTIRLTIKN